MKNLIKSIALLLVVSVAFTSCKKDEVVPSTKSIDIELRATAQNNVNVITYVNGKQLADTEAILSGNNGFSKTINHVVDADAVIRVVVREDYGGFANSTPIKATLYIDGVKKDTKTQSIMGVMNEIELNN